MGLAAQAHARTSALHALTAGELVEGYRARRFTPEDVVAAIHLRIDAVNPASNAIVAEDRAAALASARESGERWRRAEPLSGLDGVPLTIKDNLIAKGLPATWGSRLYAGNVPAHDETPVARLRVAGAIVLGKTNAPEFTLQGYTANELYGATTNPLAPGMTPGGSTGGGAAAVSAGLGPIAIGTDGGGSLRRPAAHCAIFGWKPSLGAVRREGGFPQLLHDFETCGPLARSVDDLRAVAEVLIDGPQAALPAAPRTGYFRTAGDAPVDPRIAAASDAFVTRLRSAGLPITDVASPIDPEEINSAWGVIAAYSLAQLLDRDDPDRRSVGAFARETATRGAGFTQSDYDAAVVVCARIRERAAALFRQYDILVCPSIAALAWPAAEAYPPIIDGKEAGPRGHALFTAWGNAAGLAAVSVPIAITPDAGGIGMQFIAAQECDRALIDFVAGIEAIAGFEVAEPEGD